MIILRLPNGTAAMQEMDQAYSNLKQKCDVSNQIISGTKIYARVQACKKALSKNMEQPQLIQVEYSDNEDGLYLSHRNSVFNTILGNTDLPRIVNGFPGDTIEKHPFYVTFTQAKKLRWWEKVGFIPMSCNSLRYLKV